MNQIPVIIVIGSILAGGGCSRHKDTTLGLSNAETATLASSPFKAEDHMTGINSSEEDAFRPVNGIEATSQTEVRYVKRCAPEQYQIEKDAALAEAAADPLHKTIVVRYSISVGTLVDHGAEVAQKRAVLRKGDSGITPVYVGPKYNFAISGGGAFHYVADHSKARDEYARGQKCFFNTIHVQASINDAILANHGFYDSHGSYDHTLAVMFYGDVYSGASEHAAEWSPRLFQKLDIRQDQIIPLYVADLREPVMNPNHAFGGAILNPNFVSSAVRRAEYQINYKEMLDLRKIVTHRDEIEKSFLSNATLNSEFTLQPIDAAPQLIENIIHSTDKLIVMSTQYTPIVLDLGQKGIMTSSLDEGAFFNVGGLLDHRNGASISHKSAWLGGTIQHGAAYGYQRIAEDGLLVMPSSTGSIVSGKQLFGSLLEVGGVSYANGFEALRALAHKDCNSARVQDRYFGPWDGELYTSKIKIWVDANRNGNAEPSEVSSLQSQGVLALNTCNIVATSAQDAHGNSTELRSAFLMKDVADLSSPAEDEIVNRIVTGMKVDGSEAEFRLACDILFQAHSNLYLEDVDSHFVFPAPAPSNTPPPATP
ncbi:MAG: hypothetical protein H7222_00215 [Methylotenera sp.]|nr:hypothetical protein [Oligoflexia bacterium]